MRPAALDSRMHLTVRQRASWIAHLFKAAMQQHHRELRPLFSPYIPRDAVVVDVGAHAGQFSKLFAKMAPHGRVYAFEPSAYALSVMAPAVRVTLIPMGLSDSSGVLELTTPVKRRGGLGFGTAHLGEGDEIGAVVVQPVSVTTLDAFARSENLRRLDFIKADVEGWELHALRGGEEALRRFHPALYLEVDDGMLARAGDTAPGLFAFLHALGYRAAKAPSLTPSPEYDGAGDYLFTAAEKP